MTAEEFLQKICNVIENALRGAKLKETPNDDDEGPTNLIDLLSAGETIDEGKEEIGNIVEQIYFALKESEAMEEYSQSLHPLFSREELKPLIEFFRDYHDPDAFVTANFQQTLVGGEPYDNSFDLNQEWWNKFKELLDKVESLSLPRQEDKEKEKAFKAWDEQERRICDGLVVEYYPDQSRNKFEKWWEENR